MSTPSNRAREIDDALREITLAAGAQVVFETPRGPHRRAVYSFNGRSRFDVIGTSPSSGGVLKAVRRQAKRTPRGMGASI
jgi:hypothetical protein